MKKKGNGILGFLLATANDDPQNDLAAYLANINELARQTKTEDTEPLPDDLHACTALRNHLVSRLESIIEGSDSLWEMPWIKVEIRISPIRDRFVKYFRAPSTKDGIEARIDMILVKVIDDLDLKPRSFQRCRRCGRFLYSLRGTRKTFCSTACAGAQRQKRYRERKRTTQAD